MTLGRRRGHVPPASSKRNRRRAIAAAAGLAIAMAIVAGVVGSRYIARKPTTPHLLLITLDTTRADRLGCYGYTRARTPVLDGIASSGVLIEDALTPVPITLPAHASLFTSRLPPECGIHVNGEIGLAPHVPVLAEILHDRGYRTGAFVSASVLNGLFGLDRGFDLYDDDLSRAGGGPDEAIQERRADAVVDAALRWLDTADAAPFFCWVHLFDPHFPYEPPATYLAPEVHPYDGEIAFMDRQIGRLVDWLDARALRAKTLIVVAGDHGESLGEHGEATHGFLVYDATLRVPLMFSWPDVLPAGRRIEGPASLVDVMPTVLEMLGVAVPQDASGRSLQPRFTGGPPAEAACYGEAGTGRHQFGWAEVRCLTTQRWKYIRAPAPELYDRRQDPRELNDIAATRPQVVAQLDEALRDMEQRMQRGAGQAVELPESVRRQIESLGYVGGARAADATDAPRSPREMMPVFDRYCQARGMILDGDVHDGIALMAQVASATPESVIVQCELSTACSQVGQFDKALAAAEAARALAPSSPDVFYALGVAAAGRGAFDEAEAHFRLAVELRPSFAFARNNLGLSLVELGRPKEAIEHYQAVLRTDPRRAATHYNLALAWIRLGDHPQAIGALERCERLEPDNIKVLYQLGRLLLREARYEDAVNRFRHGMSLAPDFAGFTNGLAWIRATCPHAELRNGSEAVRLAQATWEASDQTDAALLDTLAVAYAEGGRMKDAVAAAERALSLLGPEARPKLRAEIAGHLATFRLGTPVRDRRAPHANGSP